MTEELQSLLEKIHKEGVEKAKAEAEKILSGARRNAEEIVGEAERRAKEIREQAEAEGAALVERGRRSLEQAARDTVLAVGEAINEIFRNLARKEAGKILANDTLQKMLTQVAESYLRSKQAGMRLEMLVPPDQAEEINKYLFSRFEEELRKGIKVTADRGVTAGFKVTVEDGRIQHDFTDDAIGESLSNLLRPQLAEIVKQSAARFSAQKKAQ